MTTSENVVNNGALAEMVSRRVLAGLYVTGFVTDNGNVQGSVEDVAAEISRLVCEGFGAAGWGYREGRWHEGRWHLCVDRPSSSKNREIQPVYVAKG